MMRKAITFVCLFIVATVFGAPITKQRALKEATAFITKNAHRMRGANGTSVVRPKLSTEIETPAYYVFNIDKQKGFVIVSGDDKTETILGYSDNGEIDKNNLPDGLKALLEAYEANVRYPIANSANRKARAVVATKKSIPAVVPAHWNQDAPYNNNLKGNLTGCVATAMAQVMYYHRFPASCGPLKAPSYAFSDVTGTTFQWDKMTDTYSKQYSAESGQAVADLMQYCGYSVNMAYTSQVSNAYSTAIKPAMVNSFGYDPDMQLVMRSQFDVDQWNDMMYNELKAGRPIIYAAYATNGGHCFIIDGYDKGDYFHVNWGWAGMSDGYYHLPELNPSAQGLGGYAGGYSIDQQAVIGIQPDDHIKTTDQTQVRAFDVFGIKRQQDEYTRSYNGGFNNIWFYFDFRHNLHESFYAYFGVGLFDGDRLIHVMKNLGSTTVSEGESQNATITDASIPASVQDGKYQICAISHEPGKDWVKCTGSKRYYYDVEISGDKLIFDKPSLQVSNVKFNGPTNASSMISADVTIHNNKKDYNGPVFFAINSTYIGKTTPMANLHVGTKGDAVVNFKFKPTQSAGNYPYNIMLADGTVIGQGNITLTSVNLTYSDPKATITMNNVIEQTATSDGHFYGKVLSGSTIVSNQAYSEGIYNRGITVFLLEVVDRKGYRMDNPSSFVMLKTVESSEVIPWKGSITIPFEFKNLPLNAGYAVIVCSYNSSGQPQVIAGTNVYISTEGISATAADGSITTFKPTDIIDLTGKTSADFGNLSLAGLNIMASENPNCLYFVGKSSGTIPAQLAGKNVIVGGVADNIQLVNAQPYFAPYKFEAKKIAFKRTFTNGATGKPGETKKGWSTLILPFTATTVTANDKSVTWFKSKTDRTSDFWLMHFVEEDGNKVLYDYAQSLEANTPYIINMPKQGNRWGEQYTLTNKEFTFSADNVTIEPTQKRLVSGYDYTFEGTLTGCSQSDIYKLNTDGDAFTLNSTSIEINPFEAYFTMNHENTTETAAKQLAIGMIDGENGDTDGIDEMEIQSEVSFVIYNLNGMEVGRGEATLQALPHGVYIVNGRKIVK